MTVVTTVISIKDNSRFKKAVLDSVPEIVGKIADKSLGRLETEGIFVFPGSKESPDLDVDQSVLQSIDDSYRTGNIMGFLGYGRERLTVSSRFSAGEHDYFLQYMLERVLRYPNVFDMEVSGDNSQNILDLLSFLFPRFLQAAMRKGLFKTYIHVKYNDGRLNGTLDVNRHIKKNTPFVGNIAYHRREHSYDNSLTQLLRHTIEFIKQKPYGRSLLKQAKNEVGSVVEATPSYRLQDRGRVLADNQKHILRHAYFQEYRALQRLCVLILQNQKQAVGPQANRLYGVLFDGAWLWEEYVHLLIKEHFYHPMNKEGKNKQHLFTSNGRRAGAIYPDFVGKNAGHRVIADAKYKPVQNIDRNDYFQVLAYMMRFDAKTGLYLYPESGENESKVLHLNRGSTYEGDQLPRDDTALIKHGLKIPTTAKNYPEFSEDMRRAEKDFKAVIMSYVKMDSTAEYE